MTQFNPEKKERLTYAECLGTAMKITDPADAKQYFEAYVEFLRPYFGKSGKNEKGETPEQVAKTNLGYYAGYYDEKTRERVERLFCCEHPIFGKIQENGKPDDNEAFLKGVEIAQTA